MLMRHVSAAARAIDWAGGRFWRRVDRVQSGRTVTRRQHALPEPIPGAALVDDELDIVDEAAAGSPRDESFPLRIAGAASRLGVPLSRRALAVLANQVHADRRGPTTRWPERTRRAFVGLLGSGPAMVTTVGSLQHCGVFSHYLPEWKRVRSLPQRDASTCTTWTVISCGRSPTPTSSGTAVAPTCSWSARSCATSERESRATTPTSA